MNWAWELRFFVFDTVARYEFHSIRNWRIYLRLVVNFVRFEVNFVRFVVNFVRFVVNLVVSLKNFVINYVKFSIFYENCTCKKFTSRIIPKGLTTLSLMRISSTNQSTQKKTPTKIPSIKFFFHSQLNPIIWKQTKVSGPLKIQFNYSTIMQFNQTIKNKILYIKQFSNSFLFTKNINFLLHNIIHKSNPLLTLFLYLYLRLLIFEFQI